jgi:hypothetical protein
MPTTLSEYLAGRGGRAQVLVEHGRCGRALGEHSVSDHAEGVVEGVVIRKALEARYTTGAKALRAQLPGQRGPETTPGIRAERFDREPYSRAHCACLPADHIDKRRVSKLGELPVTFPEWKWGRPVDLPVVTF